MPRFSPYGYSFDRWIVDIPFTTFLSATGQANRILSLPVRYAFELVAVEIVTKILGTGAGASRVINVRKGSATGTVIGTVTALLANQAALGTVTAGTVTTAAKANVFNDQGAVPDTITVEFPTAGSVVFTAGGLDLVLTVRALTQRAA